MTDYLLEVTRVCGCGEKEQSACRYISYISVITAMALPIASLLCMRSGAKLSHLLSIAAS